MEGEQRVCELCDLHLANVMAGTRFAWCFIRIQTIVFPIVEVTVAIAFLFGVSLLVIYLRRTKPYLVTRGFGIWECSFQ